MNRKRVRVTSVDNPFDPFTQFDEWYAYDRAKGYYLSERLARVALTSDLLSDDENEEIIDNNTGKTVGNALCYYVKDISNGVLFVIDNVEINNHYKLSDKRGEELRNAIKEFAQNINKEVAGKDNTPIILGTSFNDIPTNRLKTKHNILQKLGSMNCSEIYADLFDTWQLPFSQKSS